MKKKYSASAFWFGAALGLLLLVLPAGWSGAAAPDEIDVLKQTSKAFTQIARKAMPAVVFIKVEKTLAASGYPRRGFAPPPQDMPDYDLFDFFFRDRGGNYGRQFKILGQGTGFIISKDGFILTNNHIVGDAAKITVKLHDGRELEAENIGSDPRSEIAVIKIKGADFPFLPLGNSDAIEIGEWVIAIGNPFGLSETLTVGVVSAKGRSNLGLADYEDFIQTDAAINPGNSGGPLLNIKGEAVGINTAIFSQSGGSLGIGFAIPINMAVAIKDQLITKGKVTRGYLGIAMQDITPDLAASFGLAGDIRGVLVAEVVKGSAADQAGFKPGDIIVKFDGRPVQNAGVLRNQVALQAPGTTVKAVILRHGQELKLPVTIGAQAAGTGGGRPAPAENKLGVTVENLSASWSQRLGYEPESGVIVTEVQPGSPAHRIGIEPGNLICNVNHQPIKTVDDFYAALAKAEKSGLLLLLVRDQQGARFLTIRL